MHANVQGHGPRFSWGKMRRICMCGNNLPCQAGFAAAVEDPRSPHPAETLESDERARGTINIAHALLADHQPARNGFCRSTAHGDLRPHPCTVRTAATRALERARTTLALTGGTMPLHTLKTSGETPEHQVAHIQEGW